MQVSILKNYALSAYVTLFDTIIGRNIIFFLLWELFELFHLVWTKYCLSM